MTARAVLTYQPRLLGEAEAARYLGISATKLRGIGLPRRVLDGRKLFDRYDLDAFAADLPYDGEGRAEERACDEAFGVRS